MVSFLGGNDGCKGSQREVNTRESIVRNSEHCSFVAQIDRHLRHQVGLELVQVDVERAVEAKRSRDRRDNLSNEPVQVGESRLRDAEVLLADVVDGFIVDLALTIRE